MCTTNLEFLIVDTFSSPTELCKFNIIQFFKKHVKAV